ncbi:hypothetical protein BUALT_Bualt02G0207700 [Buddleja alternifolia]|uniref:Deoxyhypusine hydroxylase n=1 Tax=Buddleja alternifolia TaxID=168488 RepID=A0AAV6YCZ9_9LAMI|nr:hypothetical protein BUALT_Bualt02G0207700 [Buddleja alternifolia]
MDSCDSELSFKVSTQTETFLCERLLDQNQPVSERFRALFSLRNLRGAAPRNALIQGICISVCIYIYIFSTRDTSNLLAHEAAFALGQMQDAEAIPALEAVLNDLSLHPITRHEAAEALGAIGLESNIPLLKNSLASDPAQEVRETCELALSRIKGLKNTSVSESSPFLSVDPAAPAACSSVQELREILLNEDKSMYERYAALFALRNIGEEEAISAIVESLGANSALLRHEVAYVLGQLQNKRASDALSEVLRDVHEHPMVRHEAAEALGSIADEECIALLEEFAKDPEPIVSQSCEVALSMLEFEQSGKSFEYFFMQTPQVEQASY